MLSTSAESGTATAAVAAAARRRSRGGAAIMAAAGNEWINGYLEAILDAGSRLRGQRQGYGGGAGAAPPPLTTAALPKLLAEAGGHQAAAAYSPTRYFVEEVVSRFDDRDLHKTWTKVRVRCVRRRWRWRRADRPPPVDRCPRSSSHESHDEQLAVMDSWLLLNLLSMAKQVVATRNSQERSNRLENLCWRIWHVARKKKQVRTTTYIVFLVRRLARLSGHGACSVFLRLLRCKFFFVCVSPPSNPKHTKMIVVIGFAANLDHRAPGACLRLSTVSFFFFFS